ncbi:MAG: radical SAM protein, partial [Deltaproteobacteria bacterium]|nr:radical SAM protein [Deltaproteobacteria bacterium]
MDRRTFIKSALASCAACLAAVPRPGRAAKLRSKKGLLGKKLSPFFEPQAEGRIRCTLCPQGCEVGPGERGACQVRLNEDGKYYTLVYGNPCAVQIGPIEKKPCFHVLPASRS